MSRSAYVAVGLIWAGIFIALAGAVPLALGHGPATAAWGLAGALLGLILLTAIRWLERRGG